MHLWNSMVWDRAGVYFGGVIHLWGLFRIVRTKLVE
jgi:hypothetical protein